MNLSGLKATLQLGGAYLRVKRLYFVYSLYANLLGWVAVLLAFFGAMHSTLLHQVAVAVLALFYVLKTYFGWLDAKAGRPTED